MPFYYTENVAYFGKSLLNRRSLYALNVVKFNGGSL